MAKESKTAAELIAMIAAELNDPTVSLSINREGPPGSWTVETYVRGPDQGSAIRAREIAQRLAAIYDLKAD